MQAAIILSASVTVISLPGLDDVARVAALLAILCSTASMASTVVALFRYKVDIERSVYVGGEGVVFLSVSLAPFILHNQSTDGFSAYSAAAC
jgi:hypothetical protein